MKKLIFAIGVVTIIPVCQARKLPDGKGKTNHKVVVEEVLQTTSYTYLHVKENDSLKWLATPSMPAKAGEIYYYLDGLQMLKFESKELHRTFDEVFFLGGVSTEPITGNKPNPATMPGHNGVAAEPYTRKATPDVKKNITIETPKDGITIAELLSHKESYAGKTVKIKGEVTKFSAAIMNKNWIHLQDGTESNGKFDLTITSADNVKVGDIVSLEGKIILNKDFGYGYFFEVMMDDAVKK